MKIFAGVTADDAWCSAAEAFMHDSGGRQESRAGDTLEILHACFQIEEPSERWVASRLPPLNPAFALAEVVWILSGRDDSGFLNFWNPRLPEFSGPGPTYYGAYGHRLRYRFGVDQLKAAAEGLAGKKDSRQIVLQIWDARADLPISRGEPRGADIPCNIASMLKVRSDRLFWTQVMRSNDLVLGFPHNVVQFTTLQEMMAAWIGVKSGSYHHFSDSLHVYETHAASFFAGERVELARTTDRWTLGLEATLDVMLEIGRRMDAIREDSDSTYTIESATERGGIPSVAANWLSIVAADAARRIGEVELARDLASRCGDEALKVMWERWLNKKRVQVSPVGG